MGLFISQGIFRQWRAPINTGCQAEAILGTSRIDDETAACSGRFRCFGKLVRSSRTDKWGDT
eukprot:scaffold24031_cov30-Prasinocladus_malaysianus.AAC.1